LGRGVGIRGSLARYLELQRTRIISRPVLFGVFSAMLLGGWSFWRAGLLIKVATPAQNAGAQGNDVADTVTHQLHDGELCCRGRMEPRTVVLLPTPSERRLCISASRQLCSPDQPRCPNRSVLLPTRAHDVQPAPGFSLRSAAGFAGSDRTGHRDSFIREKYRTGSRCSARSRYLPSRRCAVASPSYRRCA
jgi:hypothetical protein